MHVKESCDLARAQVVLLTKVNGGDFRKLFVDSTGQRTAI